MYIYHISTSQLLALKFVFSFVTPEFLAVFFMAGNG